MTLPLRHPLSSLLVGLALLAAFASLTLFRPHYQPDVTVVDVDLARGPHLTVSGVKAAFAKQGTVFTWTVRDPETGITSLGLGSSPWGSADLYVTVLPDHGVLGLGQSAWIAERRLGNVLVDYDGGDEAMRERVQAALLALRPKTVLPHR